MFASSSLAIVGSPPFGMFWSELIHCRIVGLQILFIIFGSCGYRRLEHLPVHWILYQNNKQGRANAFS